ncbi:hypothetical protein PRIPAC_85308 [Pristionchus pacificus]|uniref:Uncharacterized protein n=1 Tax=Pristionchus pacificus TaxID=54126 RepID=A0A2A6BM25_PRIPA|nr:hypothetical protein PRIPAC_85308 [Pristionchus pacificus]|eukprot:PDM66853.1 hypothetical protein PRIPAC_48270 [Pristionchus pacificus]
MAPGGGTCRRIMPSPRLYHKCHDNCGKVKTYGGIDIVFAVLEDSEDLIRLVRVEETHRRSEGEVYDFVVEVETRLERFDSRLNADFGPDSAGINGEKYERRQSQRKWAHFEAADIFYVAGVLVAVTIHNHQ